MPPLRSKRRTDTKTYDANSQLKCVATWLKPVADTIAEKFNLCCSIMIIGPVTEKGGQIETLVLVDIVLQAMH